MTHLLADDSWKTMEPMDVIACAMDKNLRMSDNVIGVISRSPTTRADVTALASGPVAVKVKMMDEPYRLHEMLSHPLTRQRTMPYTARERSCSLTAS